jgi:hypothetical protein
VYSTEYELLSDIADILRNDGVASQDIAGALSFISMWSAWSDEEYGSVLSDEKQPDMRSSFNLVVEHLGNNAQGLAMWFYNLPEALSGVAITAIRNRLNSQPSKSRPALAEALILLNEKLGNPDQSINLDFGRLLAHICSPGGQAIALNFEGSVATLAAMESPEKAILKVYACHPHVAAVSYLLKAELHHDHLVGSETPDAESDFVISVPPLGMSGFSKTSKLKSDELATLRTARECKQRGVVCVAPSLLASRSAMTVREELLNNNWLDAVIGLPRGSFSVRATAPVLLVIDKNRHSEDPIQFWEIEVPKTEAELTDVVDPIKHKRVDGRGATSSLTDIKKNDYDLTIHRYKLGQAAQKLTDLDGSVSLDGVADIVRAQSIKDATESQSTDEFFLEAAVRDITESGFLDVPQKKVGVDKSQQRRAQSQRVYSGDILLAVKGSVGRVAFVDNSCGPNWIAGQAFIIIRPKSKAISTPYLYRYLSSELIQEYLQESATGAVMTILRASDVSNIQVPLPTPDLKASVESTHEAILAEYATIEEHRDTIRRLEQQNWTLNHSNGAIHD